MKHTTVAVSTQVVQELAENESLCITCGGVGATQLNANGPFRTCLMCYSGKQTTCPHCGMLLKFAMICGCKGAKHERDALEKAKERKRWAETSKVLPSHAFTTCECLFVENSDAYVFCEKELKEHVRELVSYGVAPDDIRVYETVRQDIIIDTDCVLDMACEHLHDEAIDRIPQSEIDKLDDFLISWCANQKGTETYYPDYLTGVLVTDLV
jgi:hypothetical protein